MVLLHRHSSGTYHSSSVYLVLEATRRNGRPRSQATTAREHFASSYSWVTRTLLFKSRHFTHALHTIDTARHHTKHLVSGAQDPLPVTKVTSRLCSVPACAELCCSVVLLPVSCFGFKSPRPVVSGQHANRDVFPRLVHLM